MVGLGLSFAVRVEAEDRASGFKPVEVVGAGPDREGEERELVVVFGRERLPVLVGRFVRRDGTPVEAGFVSAVDRLQPNADGKRLPWQKVTIQDGGKFRLVVRDECPVNGSYRCELEELDANGGWKKKPERAWIDLSRGYPPCDTDIGDVTLDRSILCSGRVVDQDGEPLPEASVQAYPISPSGGQFGIGREQPVSAPDGSFTLYWDERAAPPATGLAVKATDIMAMPQDPRVPQQGGPPDRAEFETGATGIELRVFVGGLIVGSIDAEGVVIGVTRGGGWFDLMRPADRGPFRIPAMPGQVSVVVLANRGAGPELVRVDDVSVRKREVTKDPRLQDLQVAADLHCLQLRIVDEKDQPVIHACAFHQDGTFIAWSDRSGRITVAGQSAAWDLEVVAHGFQPTRISGVREDRTVVLRQGPMVRLEIADPAGIAELGQVILISLIPAEEDPARTRYVRREPLPISSEVMTRVESGGAWRVKWWFRHPGKRGGTATSAVPEEVPQVIEIADSATMQSFLLQPPLHRIREEIEKLPKPR